jgi:hypothetical protein
MAYTQVSNGAARTALLLAAVISMPVRRYRGLALSPLLRNTA